MDELFVKLKELMTDQVLYSSRIRSVVQEVVQLREVHGWMSRHAAAGASELPDIKQETSRDLPHESLPAAPAFKSLSEEMLKHVVDDRVSTFIAKAFSAGAPNTLDLKPLANEAMQTPLVLLTHVAHHVLADVAKVCLDGPAASKQRLKQLVQQYQQQLTSLAERDQVGAVAVFVNAWAKFPDLESIGPARMWNHPGTYMCTRSVAGSCVGSVRQ